MNQMTTDSAPYASNIEHLREELARAAGLLRAQLLRFQLAAPESQRERFWHLSDDYLDTLAFDDGHSPLALFDTTPEMAPLLDAAAARRAAIDRRLAASRGVSLRLPRLAGEYGLSGEETDALLLALLASLHSVYRHWFGILQHDAAGAQPTAGLIVEILSTSGADVARQFAQLAPGGKLAAARLTVLAGSDDAVLASRAVQVDDRVAMYLFGGDQIDPRAASVLRWFDQPVQLAALPLTAENAIRLEMLPNLRAAEPGYLNRMRLRFTGPDPQLAIEAAASVAAGLRQRLLVFDAGAAAAPGLPWPLVIELTLREARLAGALPLISGMAALIDSPEAQHRADQLLHCLSGFPHPAAIDMGTASGARLAMAGDWIPFQLDAPTVEMREKLWQRLLGAEPNAVDAADAVAHSLARSFQLTASQIGDAWRAARGLARHRNVFISAVEAADLFNGCRQQSSQRLVAFAQRIEPRRGLTLERDIVLPANSKVVLGELRARIRNHTRLHSAMGLGEHMRLGRGVIALFVGGSGTGKTMAAEVLASEHQIDLYRIDLASLVSKWVGETEKNLSRVFADAERANCMLFFDECDAMFGRRGDVREAHDRWANLEVNYLLQRIEDYSGVVILATNLRQNIDDAFQRRIQVVVEFPVPDALARRAIWERLVPTGAQRGVAPEDLDELAQRFELSGGNIRNVVLDACYRALDGGQQCVTARHLAAGTAREFQKTSRPVTRGDFGRFYDWAMQDVVDPALLPSADGA
ncbi:ATP-binding protein [Massilia antarctica]|uniref:ATP-binding protein n=1 Tax=Massilia antarctica TaxID=2765360 RepID=UPI0006BE0728|nr:ATP-binding protein [Massilia sp. H27-R4]MCY0916452.1 ATP-binding protein [Massilia sp. H27-R4]CUI07383.1 Cell division protein FtsH [Janthinobacterium sp. CG23_2]CUU31169.1 Cell division protein FtsH [Janthinobacterium sp. CG23_2]